jgi:sodium-independent sulfate anion transporter 11
MLSFAAPTVIEEPGDDIKQKEGLLKSTLRYTRRRAKAICTKKTLYKRLPVLNWLPRYNGHDALGDLVAGITVGLTVIPQSLAYSNVAGLPAEVRKAFIKTCLCCSFNEN